MLLVFMGLLNMTGGEVKKSQAGPILEDRGFEKEEKRKILTEVEREDEDFILIIQSFTACQDRSQIV